MVRIGWDLVDQKYLENVQELSVARPQNIKQPQGTKVYLVVVLVSTGEGLWLLNVRLQELQVLPNQARVRLPGLVLVAGENILRRDQIVVHSLTLLANDIVREIDPKQLHH